VAKLNTFINADDNKKGTYCCVSIATVVTRMRTLSIFVFLLTEMGF